MFTGTGFAQPINGTPLTMLSRGKIIVPNRSACTTGFSDTRPSNRAVGSPRRSAVQACAISCTVSENSRTTNAMNTCAKSMPGKRYRLLLPCEKRKDGIGEFGANHRRQFLSCRASHAGKAPECRQQQTTSARAHAGNEIELRTEVSHRPCLAMEGHRETVRFVTDPLNEQ